MDVDRRIKTVITGTFAIEGKSLSNANPISPVGSRRTPLISMTLTSTKARAISLQAPCAEGIYARVAAASLTLSDGKTRPPAPRVQSGWGSHRSADPLQDEAGGKNASSRRPLVIA